MSWDDLFDGSDAHLLPETFDDWLKQQESGALAGDTLTVARRVWEAATLAEREACARACEAFSGETQSRSANGAFWQCADAIRKRR